MYYLIVNGIKIAENKSFDKLQNMADAEMEGFVIEAKDWDNR